MVATVTITLLSGLEAKTESREANIWSLGQKYPFVFTRRKLQNMNLLF